MGQTSRFGFYTFGGAQGGDVGDRGHQFSIRDRQIMDSLLAALEGHDHAGGGAALADPVGAPLITLSSDPAGALPGGIDLFYRVSFIDRYGLETAASEEYTIRTPAPVLEPGAPAATAQAVTGSTLSAGPYLYAVSQFNAANQETMVGPSTQVTLSSSAGHNQVTLDLPALSAGAAGFRIYRMGPNESQMLRVGESVTPHATFVDTGLAADPNRPTPADNSTSSSNIVHIKAPDLDINGVLPPGVAAWRIYRSFESGGYDDASLVHEVTERVDQLDPNSALLNTWNDDGDPLLDGVPLEVSTTLTPSVALPEPPSDVVHLLHRAVTPTVTTGNGALFVSNGALFYVGGNGTVTQIAPA